MHYLQALERLHSWFVIFDEIFGNISNTSKQRINAHLHAEKDIPYVINLDPAVRTVPFESNIDIRDSVNYKEVMQSYNL